ncbi:transglutaminase, partial [Nocardiopsis sp. MG754419]|nr:transglutaminase [Nocardiopsis sp. MG754419]
MRRWAEHSAVSDPGEYAPVLRGLPSDLPGLC